MPPPEPSHSPLRRRLELFIQALIFYSIAAHFVEVEIVRSERSTGFWLWSERVVATIFTIEYLVRWRLSRSWLYPFGPMAIVDLLAVLPFYVGFLVDLRSLRLIRTLRVVRLFKFYRYSSALQNIGAAFHRVRHEFAVIGFALFVVGWCGALAIHEWERERQPEVFGRLTDAIWFVLVTVTTVGYGDKVPVTAEGKLIAGAIMIAGLTLFGTFISLIGGSFVEQIRRARTQASGPALNYCPHCGKPLPSEGAVSGSESGTLALRDARVTEDKPK